MMNQQATEWAEPGIGRLHDRAPFVAPHLGPIFLAAPLAIFPVGCDQLDGPFLQPFAQQVGIGAGIGDHAFGLLPRSAFEGEGPGLL
jgi:hypothetical protein